MALESFVTDDGFLHLPPSSPPSDSRNLVDHLAETSASPVLIFFLTGNPGLITYYNQYLKLLTEPFTNNHITTSSGHVDSLNRHAPTIQCVVAGFSLGGFDIKKPSTSSSPSSTNQEDAIAARQRVLCDELSFPPFSAFVSRRSYYSLSEQIELCYARLEHLCQRLQAHYSHNPCQTLDDNSRAPPSAGPTVRVVLIGHSVGAYMALELVRLHHERSGQYVPARRRQRQTDVVVVDVDDPRLALQSSPPRSHSTDQPSQNPMFDIVSSLLLTPTIVHIAQSTSGRVATPVLSNLPFVPTVLQLLSSALTTCLSESRLAYLVGKITGMRPGSDALRATVQFLRSQGAVYQALSMAGNEMQEIAADSWGEEVWGHLKEQADELDEDKPTGLREWKAPKVYLLFAKNDHWVADATRDEWLKGLQGTTNVDKNRSDKPTVAIDEDEGLVHAWCLEQSEVVARTSRNWIQEVLDSRP